MKTSTITTPRLILVPIDVGMIDSLLVSDEVFLREYGYINKGGEYLNPSPDYLHKIRARLVEHPEEYPLAVDQLIVLKESNTVIGTIYFKSLPANGISEIGYGMSPEFEGNGYMGEALDAMLTYGRENGIQKAIADTTKDNVKSQNVLARAGFVQVKDDGDMLLFEKEL